MDNGKQSNCKMVNNVKLKNKMVNGKSVVKL